MPSSGIEVDPTAVQLVSDMRLKKVKKFALFKISEDGTKVVCADDGEAKKTQTMEEDEEQWKKMLSLLKNDEPAFVVYDFRFAKENGSICEKMAFISWSNDSACPIKKKMLYASTKENTKKKFPGIPYMIDAHAMDDLIYREHAEKVEKLS